MDNYYKNLENYLLGQHKLFVYPTTGGRLQWIYQPNDIIIGIENNYIRCGWNRQSPLTDMELQLYTKHKNGLKFTSPRECSVESIITALKKLDYITLCGQLIIRKGEEILFLQSYWTIQATEAVKEWFKEIIYETTLDNIHTLVEKNNGDNNSQILLTRTWLGMLENCSRDCIDDVEILNNIRHNLFN